MVTHFRSWICLVIIVLFCCPLFGSVVFAQKNRPKNIQVALKAKWPGTSLLLEAGELLSKEWRNNFFDFTESWLQAVDGEPDVHTAKDCLKKIINHGKSLLTEPLASVFEFSLTLRSASPRLELYRQLAEDSLASFPLADDVSLKNSGGKCCWVDTGSSLYFDIEELLIWIRSSYEIVNDPFQQPEIFEFDHVHKDSAAASPVAVLYGALGTDCFRKFHPALVDAARQGRVTYVVRPVMVSGCISNSEQCGAVGIKDPVNLAGYGVELALKNMEYKAMDDSAIKKGVTLEDPHIEDLSQDVRGFIFSRILERKPELSSEIMSFRDYLLSSTVSDTLDVWELKDLGHQTAQRIVHASDPLQAMQEINQNFPSVVSSLSRMKLNESIKDEIVSNQRMIPPGKSLMALNGALINIDDIDLYMLIDMVHQELSLADQYSKLKIPPSDVRKLLSAMPPSESKTFRVDFRSNHVHYLNNLEDDSKYKRWRSNLNEILMPVFPGQLRHIRKNLYHAVYIIDPASICGLEAIDTMLMLHENNIPMRFGVILYSGKIIKSIESNDGDTYTEDDDQVGQDVSSLIIRLFIYIEQNHGILTAFQFLSNVNKLRIESAEDDMPEMHHVEAAFVDTILPQAKSRPQDTLLKLQKEQTYSEQSHESSMFVFKLGLTKLECCLLMNGLVYESTEEEILLNAMNDELPRIQEQVYYGQINSHTDVLDKFLSESGIRRYNPQIIGNGKIKPKIVSLCPSVLGGEDSVLNEIGYLHTPETIDDVKPVTHFLVVNISSKKGIKLLHEGLRYLMGGSELARMGVLFNANQSVHLRSMLFMKVFEITASSYSHKKGVLKFLDELCSFIEHDSVLESSEVTDKDQAFLDKIKELADANGIPSKYYESDLSGFTFRKLQDHFKKEALFIRRELGIGSDVNAVVTNGRVVTVPANVAFLSHDLNLLENLEFNQRVKHLFEIIEENR
ncbi:hypothetical protein Leryth_013981 [Lithospermum erythrorhizon]|nr:hypothetical protein Leryth_013981 [Lithospermum erythrorhizon]